MSTPHVLVLGGHGKIAMVLQRLLLAKSWNVTSVVRNTEHETEILNLVGKDSAGQIDVLVEDLDQTQEASQAKSILEKVKPDIVVWSAGAGGKGGPARTKAVDQVAAMAFISASLALPTVKKFLLVSYIASRKGYPPWWNDDDKKAADKVNNEILPNYFKAKVEADEHFEALTKKRLDSGDHEFQAINLRPGTLTDSPGSGRVRLGKTPSRGSVAREDVARVAAALLERDDTRGWFDLLEGDTPIAEAVDAFVKAKHSDIEGENLQRIWARET